MNFLQLIGEYIIMAKGKAETRIKAAVDYAIEFYCNHDRSLDNQRACRQEMMNITGLSLIECDQIHSPVVMEFFLQETMNIGNELINIHMRINSHNITQHILSINSSIIIKLNAQEAFFDEEEKSPYIDEGTKGTVETVASAIVMDDLRGGVVLKNVNNLQFSNRNLTDKDLGQLVQVLKTCDFSINVMNLHNNHITNRGADQLISLVRDDNYRPYYMDSSTGKWSTLEAAISPQLDSPRTLTLRQNIAHLNLSNNDLNDGIAQIISEALSRNQLPALKSIDLSGNHFTSVGLEHLATSVRKIKAKTIAIKVATADTLQEMKEFLTKGFNYYTKTHKVVVNKEFADELSGVNISACDKTKSNMKESFVTGAFITSLTTGNDYFILLGGAEAGAGALLSPDAANCLIKLTGKARDWVNDVE
jgi:hypothetical protein